MRDFLASLSFSLIVFCIVLIFQNHYLRIELDVSHKNDLENAEDAVSKQQQLTECLDANYDLTARINDTQFRNDSMVEQYDNLYRRFKGTTDVLESVTRCSIYKLDPKSCGWSYKRLNRFIDRNRKDKF